MTLGPEILDDHVGAKAGRAPGPFSERPHLSDLDVQGTDPRVGDVVLIGTGRMTVWSEHPYLLAEAGVPIMENVDPEELVRVRPSRVRAGGRGATAGRGHRIADAVLLDLPPAREA